MWAWCRVRSACCLLPYACCLLFAAGCRNCDLVEAELRSRDRDLREMKEELYKAEAYNNALQSELHAVRQDSSSKITPELASQTYTLKSIKLGRGTGGYDDDDHPGDEALQVIMEPIDLDRSHPKRSVQKSRCPPGSSCPKTCAASGRAAS